MALVTLAYKVLEYLRRLSQVPSFVYIGLAGKFLLSLSSRKYFSLCSDA